MIPPRRVRGLVCLAWLLAVSPVFAFGTGDPELRRAARFIERTLESAADPRFFWSTSVAGGQCRLSLLREDRSGGNRLHAWVPMARVEVWRDRGGALSLDCRERRCIEYRQILGGERIDGSLDSVELPRDVGEVSEPFADALRFMAARCRSPFAESD